jgi:anti-sigma B factor antagonist
MWIAGGFVAARREKTSMQITQELTDVVVLAVPGPSLDASNTKKFKNEMAPVVQSATRLVFDMSGVQFVDSSGLGAILSCLRQLNAKGGDIKVFGLSKGVRALFELVRMHRVVEIHNTREEALSAFAA